MDSPSSSMRISNFSTFPLHTDINVNISLLIYINVNLMQVKKEGEKKEEKKRAKANAVMAKPTKNEYFTCKLRTLGENTSFSMH